MLAHRPAARVWAVATALSISSSLLAACSAGQPRDSARARARVAAPQPLPVDPRFRVGQLDNGLTYYIAENGDPGERAELRLAVNVGSVLEDDDQRGLAHFVEHMAFNGTENYRGMAIRRYLESLGLEFGTDVSADTNFDKTVYRIQMPTDQDVYMPRGIGILREWAGRVRFDADEVEKERGVIREEIRLRKSAMPASLKTYYTALLAGSRYADRLPQGLAKTIATASRADLLRFYRDWYRPDLMAVVVVGDVDAAVVEKEIRKQFSDLKAPAAPRERPTYRPEPRAQTHTAVTVDPTVRGTSLDFTVISPRSAGNTDLGMRRFMREQFFAQLIKYRLSRKQGAPWTDVATLFDVPTRWLSDFTLRAQVRPGHVAEALRVLVLEVERIEAHGFSRMEVEEMRGPLLSFYQSMCDKLEMPTSAKLADDAVGHYLDANVLVDAEQCRALTEDVVASISVRELHAYAARLGARGDRLILVNAPSAEQAGTRAALEAQLDAAEGDALASDEEAPAPVYAELPAPGRIVESNYLGSGVLEWKLSNGARVLIKNTRSREKVVYVNVLAPGGRGQVPAPRLGSAWFLPVVLTSSWSRIAASSLREPIGGDGTGEPSFDDRNLALENHLGRITARALPGDLGALLEATHMVLTEPSIDPDAWNEWRDSLRDKMRITKADAVSVFRDQTRKLLMRNDPRYRAITPEQLAAARPEQTLAMFRQQFGSADGLTFVFVGDVYPNQLKPLVEKYVGSLPHGETRKATRGAVRFPSGIKRHTMQRGSDPSSNVDILFLSDWNGPDEWLALTRFVLRQRLHDVLREEMGKVYHVDVSTEYDRSTRQTALVVSFVCDPKNARELERAVLAEAGRLRQGGGQEYIEAFRASARRELEANRQSDSAWLEVLERTAIYGVDPDRTAGAWQRAEKVGKKALRTAARRLLDPKSYLAGFLMPEPSLAQSDLDDASPPAPVGATP